MPIAINCPNCEASFRLADEMAGKRARCKKCQHVFAVPVPDPEETGVTASEAKAPAPPMQTDDDAEPNNAVTTKPKRERPDDNDEDDEPRGKRRSERDGSRRNQRPIAKSGGGMSTLTMVLLGLGLLSCACCGVAGPAAYFVWDVRPAPAPQMVVFDRVEKNKEIAAPKFDGFKEPPPFGGFKDKGNFDGFKNIPQGPPAIPTTVVFGPDGSYRSENTLSRADAFNQIGKPHKAYLVQLEANAQYQIDMTSAQFDPYLLLLDAGNKILLRDDDGGGYPQARILFRPAQTAQYRIEATSFGFGQGNYTLAIKRTGAEKK